MPTVHLAHIQATHLLSPGNSQSSGCLPQVLQQEVKGLLGHRLQTLASYVGQDVSVAACGILCVFVPRVPLDQSSSISALSTFMAGSFFVQDCPGHHQVLSSTPGLSLLDAGSSHLSPVVTARNVSRPCQMGAWGSVAPG